MSEVLSTFDYAAMARQIEEQLLRHWDQQSGEAADAMEPPREGEPAQEPADPDRAGPGVLPTDLS